MQPITMKQSHKKETSDMKILGKIMYNGEDDQHYLKSANKSGDKYLWKPQGYFNSVLKKYAKDNQDKEVFVMIHVHMLDKNQGCEKD